MFETWFKLVDTSEDDKFAKLHAGSDAEHVHSHPNTELKNHHNSFFSALMELPQESHNGIITIGKRMLQGCALGLLLFWPKLIDDNLANYEATSEIKMRRLMRTNAWKFVKISGRPALRYCAIGAGVAVLHYLVIENLVAKMNWKYEASKWMFGYSLFFWLAAGMVSPRFAVQGAVGGLGFGAFKYFDKYHYTGSNNGIIYLPTEDPKVLAAREKLKEREIIYAMSLDLKEGHSSIENWSRHFD